VIVVEERKGGDDCEEEIRCSRRDKASFFVEETGGRDRAQSIQDRRRTVCQDSQQRVRVLSLSSLTFTVTCIVFQPEGRFHFLCVFRFGDYWAFYCMVYTV